MMNLVLDQLLLMPKIKKILITGGLGCLGLNLAIHFSNKGYNVSLVDNLTTNVISPNSIPRALLFFFCDIQNFDQLEKIFEFIKPDFVIHSAASYDNPKNWIRDIKTNVEGITNLIKLSEEYDVKKFINFQTIHCYKSKKKIDEKCDKLPLESYSISKVAAEELLTISSLNFISLRLTIVFGPWHFNGPIPIFYKKIFKKQHCQISQSYRDFIYMEDFLRLIDKLLKIKKYDTSIFNVSSGKLYSIVEIFNKISKLMNKKTDFTLLKEKETKININSNKIRKFANWMPIYNINEGLRKQILWFNENFVGESHSHNILKNE